LQETARLAFSDIGRIIGPDGKVLLPNELDDDTRAAVSSFKIDEYGRIEYKFWDKNNASERLFKHQNLYKENNEGTRPLTQVAVISLVPLEPLGNVIDAER
jgi:phage terminase small subunit